MWKCKGPRGTKTTLKKKVGGFTLPDFKTNYQAKIIKTVWSWHKNRQIDQWNRIETPEIGPHICALLIFNKCAKGNSVEKG